MTETGKTKIADGVIRLTEPEYRPIKRMNASVLEWGMESMAHCKAAYDGELAVKTTALAFGTAGHVRLLEPHLYAEMYAVRGKCEDVTEKKKPCANYGRARFDGHWFCGTHEPTMPPDAVDVTSEDEAETIEKLAAKVKAHPAVALLRQSGGCEMAILWTDTITGIECKGKLDKWMPECFLPGDTKPVPTVLDLKYLRAVDARSISNAVEEYGWGRRAAMYREGVKVLTGLVADYILVCIEKTPPYSVVVKMLGDETLRGGAWEFRNLLNTWAGCVKTGIYPGYAMDISSIEAPDWKLKAYARDVL